jgi:Tol biopolymer transport system component
VLHSDESNKYRLVSIGDGAVYNPRWSPDGDTIAFVYEPVGNLHHIMLIPADGSSRPASQNQALITVLDFDWHPDGRGLAVAAQGIQDIPQNALWFFSNREIRSIGDQQMPLFVDYPRYGPDGHWLAFRSAYELTVYDTQQNRVHGFGPDSYNNNPPAWSPAGFQGEAACLP